eukprot:Blabericola_migrator_1__73@NODE_1019_length_5676_cov_15_746835_g700_i0_p1_GENE_NODE_1019_length_5676_cov_15_746835_g700_i0NODE_1019_length_5676_cov_15_746835_g700_i0_p1_ORF_typecomplete_len1142_score183_29_NODE_1019_length_5676_cov_15_746835_g700_i015094934
MRGLVLKEITLKLPLLRATALVLVSGPKNFGSSEASDNGSAPGLTRANTHGSDSGNANNDLLTYETSLGDSYHSHETPTSSFSPDVTLAAPTPVAAPAGYKRNCSDAEGEPVVKKPRCNTPHEPLSFSNAAVSSEDPTLEDLLAALESSTTDGTDWLCGVVEPTDCCAPAKITSTAPQHLASTSMNSLDFSSAPIQGTSLSLEHRDNANNVTNLIAWLDVLDTFPAEEEMVFGSLERDAGHDGAILNPQVASVAELTHVIHGGISVDTTAPALELGEEWMQNVPLAGNVQRMASQEDQPAGPHSGTISSLSEGACNMPNNIDRTSKNSIIASTSGELTLQPLSGGRPGTVETLSLRSFKILKEKRSPIYNAAQVLLLAPEGAKRILNSLLEATSTRTKVNYKLANSPYLSSSWLLERLVLHDKVPIYSVELQTAFESYGYDNVLIPDMFRNALNLAYTLKLLGKVIVPDDEPVQVRNGSVCFSWAAALVRDAFFGDRPLRPDLKAYLRNKLKIQNVAQLKLPFIQGQLREAKGGLTKIENDIRLIQRAMNPRPSESSHPLDFITFFTDVCTLVRGDDQLRKTIEESSASAKTKKVQPKATGRRIVGTSNKIVGIVTKYKRLFDIDLIAELETLLKLAPNGEGSDLFESAVKEGYVPSNLLQPEMIEHRRFYNLSTHCLLGSIAALYRRLFEDTEKTAGDSDDRFPELDVVQEYLMQPSPTTLKEECASTLKEFDLLSAASEALKLGKDDLYLSTNTLEMPDRSDDINSLIRSYAPFGSPHWILTQVMYESCPTEYRWRRNELQFALNLIGHQSIDIKDVFARALVLAESILREREVPFDRAKWRLKLSKTAKPWAMAADIIHAALFHSWPQRRDLIGFLAQQIRYEVLPEHKECLTEVLARREELYPFMSIRMQKGDRGVVTDWMRIRTAKTLAVENVEDCHPLSFDRFWEDICLISGNSSPAIPAIASKYKVLFDRNIIEDLSAIRASSPNSRYRNSFVEGIEEGYVPYRYAQLLTRSSSKSMTVNMNGLLFLGALVDYYISLVGSADTTASKGTPSRGDIAASQKISVTETLSDDNGGAHAQNATSTRLDPDGQTAQLMAILRRAPKQKPVTAEVAAIEPPNLHPVAQYLLGRLPMDAF